MRAYLLVALLASAPAIAIAADEPAADAAFSQQVILVTVAKGLDEQFIADTYRLATIPGVVSVRIGKPVDFGPDHQNPDWWIGDYHYAVFIEFADESVTDAYGAHPLHEAWGKKWGVKELPTFRALRAVGPAR